MHNIPSRLQKTPTAFILSSVNVTLPREVRERERPRAACQSWQGGSTGLV